MSAVLTAFTPAASCLAPTYTVAPLGNDTVSQLTAIRGYATGCFENAPVATGYPTASGIECPSGYGFDQARYSSDGSTSYGTCCPSGYTVQSTLTSMCSAVKGYNSVTVVDGSQTTPVHAIFLWAPALAMSWQSGQMTPTPTPAPTVGPTSTLTYSSAAALATTIEHGGSSGESTTSLAVGISLGVVAGILGLIALIIGVWRYRTDKKSKVSRAHGRVEMVAKTMDDAESQYETASERSNRSSESLPGYPGGLAAEPEEKKEEQ